MRWSERRTAVRSTFEMTSTQFHSEPRALSSAVAHLVLVRPKDTTRHMKTLLFSLITAFAIAGSPAFAQSEDGKSSAGPPEEVVKQKFTQTWGPTEVQSIKRGEPLISRGGQVPAGTVIFPIRMVLSYKSLAIDLYFFKDEFGEWKYFTKGSPRVN